MPSIFLVAPNNARPTTYFSERGLTNNRASEMSELVCNAIKV